MSGEKVLSHEELVEAVAQEFLVHYSIPDIKKYIYAYNWQSPQDPNRCSALLQFYLAGKFNGVVSPSNAESGSYKVDFHIHRHITPSIVANCAKQLLDSTVITLHTALLDVCANRKSRLRSTATESVFRSTSKWRDDLLTHPWIRAFYDVDVLYDEKKTHAIATFTNKDRNRNLQCKAYLVLSKTGVKISNADNVVFQRMENAPSYSVNYSITESYTTRVTLDIITGTLFLPKQGYCKTAGVLSYWEMLHHDRECVKVRHCRAYITHDGVLERSCVVHTVSLDKSGRPVQKTVEENPDDTWLSQLQGAEDLVKNPMNTDSYPYLDPEDYPYAGENVFVTILEDVYVKVHGEYWVIVKGGIEWIMTNSKRLPSNVVDELQRYLLSKRLKA